MQKNTQWPKTITVDKRIVGILSVSTYRNFPKALKEIITNSYDADALKIQIDVDLINEKIIILDDGKGMNSNEFDLYLRIAGKDRKKNKSITDLGRHIIGQFGVGFLSVFPFFKNYEIYSTKTGSEIALNANIPLARYFDMSSGSLDVGNIKIDGNELYKPNEKSISYTKIILSGFNDLTKSFFQKKGKVDNKFVDTYPGIDKLKWSLSEDLPLEFRVEKFNRIFNYRKKPKFDVYLNQEKLYRNLYGEKILDTHSNEYDQIGKIKFKYFISTPNKSIRLRQGRYLKIRNLNVGVGDKREDFSDKRGGNRNYMHWLTGEVHILDGLNELIKVSRDDFNYSNDYESLKDFFNQKLQHFSNRLDQEIELKNQVRHNTKDFKVKNVKLLNKEFLENKIKKFQESSYKHEEQNNNEEDITNQQNDLEFEMFSNDLNLEKRITVSDQEYILKSDSWDFEKSEKPACKIEGDYVIVNTNYPLFKGLKYTDIFFKLNLLLLRNLRNGFLDEKTFLKLTNDILVYFADYKK